MFVGQVHKPSTPTLYHHISNKFFNKSYKALAMLAMAAKRDTKKKKCLFLGVKILETSNKSLRKRLFRLSRWPSKAIDGNTVEKDVSTAFPTLEESILFLLRVKTLYKKCWITSHITCIKGHNPRNKYFYFFEIKIFIAK